MFRSCRIVVAIFALLLVPQTALAQSGITKVPEAKKKISLDDIGVEGRDNLRNIGQSYGMEICGNGFIAGKDEIKKKAWPRLQAKCSKFTLQIMNNYTDDPNRLFSLCVGGSLYGCQKAIDIAYPCDDLKSCKDYLGVP